MPDTFESLMTERLDIMAQHQILNDRQEENDVAFLALHQANPANDWQASTGTARVIAVDVEGQMVMKILMDHTLLAAKVVAIKAILAQQI